MIIELSKRRSKALRYIPLRIFMLFLPLDVSADFTVRWVSRSPWSTGDTKVEIKLGQNLLVTFFPGGLFLINNIVCLTQR